MDATNPTFTAAPALNSAERWNTRIDAKAAEMRAVFEAAGKPVPAGLQAAAGHLTGHDDIGLALDSASANGAWDAYGALAAYAGLVATRVLA